MFFSVWQIVLVTETRSQPVCCSRSVSRCREKMLEQEMGQEHLSWEADADQKAVRGENASGLAVTIPGSRYIRLDKFGCNSLGCTTCATILKIASGISQRNAVSEY